jgi:hypothetical protein
MQVKFRSGSVLFATVEVWLSHICSYFWIIEYRAIINAPARLGIAMYCCCISARVAAAWRQKDEILPVMTSGFCDWRGDDPFLLHAWRQMRSAPSLMALASGQAGGQSHAWRQQSFFIAL